MPNANNKVPTPTVPPKYHPILTTEISKVALTPAMGKFVTFCKPIINPSLGPAPKLEITPESCRLRKAILDPHERKRSEKAGTAA